MVNRQLSNSPDQPIRGQVDIQSDVSTPPKDENSPLLGKPLIIDPVDDDVVALPIEEALDPLTPPVQLPPLRRAIFTMLPLFMGYATMVTLQAHIKHRLDIGNNGSASSYEFSFATSLIYFANLVFRLMHNVIFSMLRPRYRVCVAYTCMGSACAILGFAYYVFESKALTWTYVAYLLAGVAVGTFESNLISCITPLGHGTKVWAQYGIPLGFSGISIGAFGLFAFYPGDLKLQMSVYFFVALANMCGLVFWLVAIPDITFESTAQSIRHFGSDIKQFKQWIILVLPYACSLFVDMFAVSMFSAIQLFIYDIPSIPLWPGATMCFSKDVFRVLFNLGSMMGDASGRKLAYWTPRHIRPYLFLVLSVAGGACILSKVAILAPIGMVMVMHANGEVYAHATKYIDDKVPRRFNLIGLSFWLFVGDIGSFAGANAVNAVRVVVGGVAKP